jgi:uracil-DNA glycosylase family 4
MGFFTQIKNNNPDCGNCGLYKESKNPQIGVFGKGKKKILILTKAPTKEQDENNNLFLGGATKLFEQELKKVGIDLYEDCFVTSALGCRTSVSENHKLKKNVDFCRNRVRNTIKKIKPSTILCLGTLSLYAIFGEKNGVEQVTGISVENFRDFLIPCYEYGCNVVAIHHPVAALQNEDDVFWTALWKKDLEFFAKNINTPVKKEIEHKTKVNCLYDYEEIVNALTELKTNPPKWCCHDYEGTGTDIFIEGSRIETIAFAPIYDISDYNRETQVAYAFPYQRQNHFTEDQQKHIKQLWIEYLNNEKINKVAHNINLEYSWELVGFETDTQGYYWDSMVVANQMNCTPGTRGLKHLALMYEGQKGYGSEAKSYFERKQENGLNYIHEFPLNKLLLYNGLDALLNAYIFAEQYHYFKCDSKRNFSPREAMWWYNKIAKEMARYHAEGVCVDMEYFRGVKSELQEKYDALLLDMSRTKEVRSFVAKEGREPNYGSSPDLRKLFFEYGNHEVIKETAKGEVSVDKEVMHELKGECAEKLLEMRKLDKIVNTYIAQFERLEVDGRVHPSFMVMLKTMRTSCNNPNLQNISKHDPLQKKTIRRGIIADKDCHFAEIDYSALELWLLAFICNDPVFMHMLDDPKVDCHSEFTQFWFDFHPDQVSKQIRNFSKSGISFAQAYGSNYWACAKKTWEWLTNNEVLTGDDITLAEHLRINGIKTERDFINYWEEKEEEYWDKFKVWREYQNKVIDIYLKNGYVETPSGYRRRGLMSKNKCLNSPSQNAGAFVLLTSACYINEQARKNKMRSRLMMQVHDSNIGSIYTDEKQDFLDLVEYGMTDWTFKQFPFLKKKLAVEVEMTPEPNMSWYDLKVWDRDENGIWRIKD